MSHQKELCRLLFESASDAILVMQHGRFIDCNASAASLFGCSYEQLRDRTLLDFSPPTQPDGGDSEQLLQQRIDAALAGERQQFEWLHQRSDGETFQAQVVLNCVEFDDPPFVQVSVHDITEFKQLAVELRKKEEQYRDLYHEAPHAYFSVGAGDRIQMVNQSAVKLIGYSLDDLIGSPIYNLYPDTPAGKKKAQALFARIRAGKRVHSEELEMLRADGKQVWVSLTVQPIQDEQGEIVGSRSMVMDITQRKQIEMALRESEERYRDQYHEAPHAYLSVGTDGRIQMVNQSAVDLLGHNSMDDLIGRLALNLYANTPAGKEKAKQVFERFRSGAEIRGEEMQMRRANGTLVWVSLSVQPVRDGQGNVIESRSVVVDITERKRLDRQFQKSLERRGRQVQVSTQVSQEIAAATREDELYGHIVTVVKEQFGYYHTQLFRYNPNVEALVLAAGYDEIGAQMLAEGCQVSIGSGLVGAVAASGVAILHSDLSNDPAWQPHPLLPDTKGELAVPIKIGREDIKAQSMALEYFINSGFDGCAVAAIDPVTIVPVTRKAIDKGVSVVSCSADLGEGNQTALVGAVEYEMGYTLGVQAGNWAREHIPAGEILKVGVLNYRVIPQTIQREEGIIDGIKATFGLNIEIVGSEAATDSTQGFSITEQWLKAHLDLDMIVAINDAGALGAYQAAIMAGKNDPDTFFVGGIDAVDKAVAAIKAGGAYQATVEQPAKEMGVLAIRILVAAILDQPYQKVNTIDSTPVNRSNVDQFLGAGGQTAVLDEEAAAKDLLAGMDLSGLKIGLSVMTLSNPFFVALAAGAKEEADRLGVELVVNEPKQVLGVLAVQSDVTGLLDTEDQLALEGLCGQIAFAIESLRLRREMEDRLHELNALQRLMSREGWREFQAMREQAGQGYLFDQTSVRPVSLDELPVAGDDQVQKKMGAVSTANNGQIVARSMAVHGEAVGTLGVYDDPDNPLTPEDQAFLDSITEQVAEALERARLLEQSQTSLAETENLYNASRRVNEAADLQEVIAAVAESGPGSTFNRALLEVFEQDQAGEVEALTVAANWHSGAGRPPVPIGARYPLAQFPYLRLFLNPEPLFFDDIQHDERIDSEAQAVVQQLNIRAAAVLPLWVGARQVGVLMLEAEEVHHFTEPEIRPYISLAGQVAVAVENQRLLVETSAALAEVEATQRRYTVQAWETYRARDVVLSHEQTREGIKPLGDNLPPEAGQAVAQRQAIVASGQPSPENGKAFGGDGQPPSEAAQSSLVVPLAVRNEIIGVLGLQETDNARHWTPGEIALVEAVGEQLAQAAENLRLIDETQQRVAHEKRVNEIGEKIQAAQSMEEALQVAIKEVGLSLQTPQTTVRLEVK